MCVTDLEPYYLDHGIQDCLGYPELSPSAPGNEHSGYGLADEVNGGALRGSGVHPHTDFPGSAGYYGGVAYYTTDAEVTFPTGTLDTFDNIAPTSGVGHNNGYRSGCVPYYATNPAAWPAPAGRTQE